MSEREKIQARKSELIARIYAGALNPSTYLDLLKSWDAHFTSLGEVDERFQISDFDWTRELIAHFDQADEVFEQLDHTSAVPIAARLREMAEIAFVVDSAGRVPHMNTAAAQALGCVENTPVDELNFDPDSRHQLETLRSGLLDGSALACEPVILLRLFTTEKDDAKICAASIIKESSTNRRQVLIRSVNAHWHSGTETVLRTSFGLTKAELGLVKALYLGRKIRDISVSSGRSEATLRSQLSSVLNKIGIKNQTGLAQAMSGLNHVLIRNDMAGSADPPPAGISAQRRQRDRTVEMSDGSMMHLVESGDLEGAPFFFIQTTTWPTLTPSVVDALTERGVRLISPYRSGLGQTTPKPTTFGPDEWAGLYAEVLDRLGIDRIALGGQCSGGVYAMALAARLGERCRSLLLVDTGAPLRNARMINQMPLAPRRLFLGARYFPMALRTPYKLVTADFYSSEQGQARGVDYFVEGSPADLAAVADRTIWTVVRDNVDYCLRNPQQAARDVCLWSHDTTPRLGALAPWCHVRFLHGRGNLVHRADNLEAFVHERPKFSARIVEGESQLLVYRRPDIFADEVAAQARVSGTL